MTEDRQMTRSSLPWRVLCCVGSLLLAAGCNRSDPLPETPPRQVSESPFHYPEELWDAGVEGQTVLKVFVAENGQVDTVHVEQSSGHAAFDTAAVTGAHRLLFEPALRGDQPMGVWVLLPVQFDMTNAAERSEETP
jgi:periplasmic protein TonB